MGWDNVFHCEWAEFPRKILAHYWPQAQSYHDITSTDFSSHDGQIDILTGGFPCQPYSAAGKRKGKNDDRHLWPDMLRCIREVRPRWVVGENVYGLATWNGGLVFEEVCADLEAEGYAIQPFVLPAAAVNAPHRRDRIWFIAYANGIVNRGTAVESRTAYQQKRSCQTDSRLGDERQFEPICDVASEGHATDSRYWETFPTQSPICCGDDGLPAKLDGITFSNWRNESIKGYGNAIVPQVALEIFKAIQQWENLTSEKAVLA